MPISSALRADVLGFNATSNITTIDGAGLLTVSATYNIVAANSGVTDNLDNIALDTTTTFNPILILVADTGDTITLRHNYSGTGNIFLHDGISSVDITSTDPIFMYYNQSTDRVHQLSAANDTLGAIAATNHAMIRGNGTNWVSYNNNFNASIAPTANDDINAGYAVGSIWVNTTDDDVYIAADVTAAAAIWTRVESPNVATVSTSNATITTIVSIAILEEESAHISFDIIANKDDFTNGAYGSIRGGFYRATGGNVIAISSSSSGGDKIFEYDGVSSTPDVYFETTTNAVLIRVVGVASENWNWKVNYTIVRQ